MAGKLRDLGWPSSWRYSSYRSLWAALDLLLPPTCASCGAMGARWCADCQGRVEKIAGPVCQSCGQPVRSGGLCSACEAERPVFHALRSWAIYTGPLREALLRLKYRKDVALGDSLVSQMTEFASNLAWPIDIVIPVPLARSTLKERGYNQAALLAWPLSIVLKRKYAPQQLTRARETRSQVGLTRKERRENVHAAFAADGRVAGKAVLLIDDIATTGSTLSSAAEALHAAGASDVYALTVARAQQQHELDGV